MTSKNDLIIAYRHCSGNRKRLESDERCACFSCERFFHPKEITSWIPEKGDETALCPFCNSDSVLGESSGFPITQDFIKAMNVAWRFQRPTGS